MSYRLLVISLVGCATAGEGARQNEVDASPQTDGPIAIDAPEPCNEITTQLLVNPSFDTAPIGTGWTETLIDPMFPIVTPDNGVAEQTAPNKAWMGGLSQANANDQLFQDVVIPARTSSLVLTGFYDVRTGEVVATVKDTATVTLVKLDSTLIESVLSTNNTLEKADWTPLDHTFPMAGMLSGQTVRLRFATSNDAAANTETSFYFDTLAMTATHCQ